MANTIYDLVDSALMVYANSSRALVYYKVLVLVLEYGLVVGKVYGSY